MKIYYHYIDAWGEVLPQKGEHDQRIPQSLTADQPRAPYGRAK